MIDLFRNGPRPRDNINPPPDNTPPGQRQKSGRSWMWRGAKYVASSPFSAVPFRQIVRNGQLIGEMASSFRRGPSRPRVVPQGLDGKLDKAATAFLCGISEAELEDRLIRRRGYTAWTAYASFGLGWLFVILWVNRLLGMPWPGQRIIVALQFAPFCLVFFLTAFKQAHVNWQLRTGVLGTAGDYLRSPAPFWPRP